MPGLIVSQAPCNAAYSLIIGKNWAFVAKAVGLFIFPDVFERGILVDSIRCGKLLDAEFEI